jgi:hypothetical protein
MFVGASQAASTPTLIAETEVAVWKCQDHVRVPRTAVSVDPWKIKGGQAYKRWVLNLWRGRLTDCQETLAEVKRQWNWQAWLPDKWRRIGVCETGLNWLHSNSSYVSSFGIQRGAYDGAYDHDARRVGMPPWDDKRPPTPWQQWRTAVSHFDHHGGFSGWGCRNA